MKKCLSKLVFGIITASSMLASATISTDESSGFYSPVINLSSGKNMDANGNFIASGSLTLRCGESLTGSGYLESPSIEIIAKKFAFTGTIKCNGSCRITVQEPFDASSFKRQGTGQFIINIEPDTNIFEQDKMHNSAVGETRTFNIDGSEFTFSGQPTINFIEAIKAGDLLQVRTYLEEKKIGSNARERPEVLGLFMVFAGLSNQMPIVDLLIQAGANVNGQDAEFGIGQKHLITAITSKKTAFVEALLNAGANPNVQDADWMPGLIIAVLLDDFSTVQALLKSPNIAVNARDRNCRTALMYAIDKPEMVKILLAAGADKHAVDLNQRTALYYARASNQEEVIQLLRTTDVAQQKKGDEQEGFRPQQEASFPDVKNLPVLIKDLVKDSVRAFPVQASLLSAVLLYKASRYFYQNGYFRFS